MKLGRSFSSRATSRLALALAAFQLSASLFAQSLTPRRAEASAPPDQLDLRFANGAVAEVEGKVITVEDVRRELAPMLPQIQRESKNEKEFHERLDSLRDDVVQNLIDRVLIVKEFRKDGRRMIPSNYIDRQIAEILSTQFDNDRSKFLAYLRGRGETINDYRKEVEDDIIYNYMRSQQGRSQSVVSPVKVEAYYKENIDKFYQEDGIELRIIQLKRETGQGDELLKERAEEILARFKAGEKFEDLAKEFSQDPVKRSKGGDWGWLKRSDLKPELSDTAFKLEKGQSSEPIIVPLGDAFILYAADRRLAGTQKLDDVRDQIEHLLIQQMTRANQEQWLERLRRNGYVKHY